MKDFGETTAETSSTLNKRLAEAKVESEKRLTTMSTWQVAMQASAARSIEILTQLMKRVAAASNNRYWKDHKHIADFAARAKHILQSGHHVQLRRIATMGRKVDVVNQKANDLLHWAQKYASLTHDWRRDVIEKLNEVSGVVSEDLQMLVAGGKSFKLTLDSAADYEQKLLEKKLADELKIDQSNTDNASQTAAAAINRALNLMKRSGEEDLIVAKLKDAYGAVHPHSVENATHDIHMLLSGLGGTKTAEAVRAYISLTAKKSADITGAQGKLQEKFDQLEKAVGEALPHISSFSALKENAALLEEQSELSQRMTNLLDIVSRRANPEMSTTHIPNISRRTH